MAPRIWRYLHCKTRFIHRFKFYIGFFLTILLISSTIYFDNSESHRTSNQTQRSSLFKILNLNSHSIKLACTRLSLMRYIKTKFLYSDAANSVEFYPASKQRDFPLSTLSQPYNLNIMNTCLDTRGKIIVFLVHSAIPNTLRRSIIRSSWGKKQIVNNYNFKTVFFLGKPTNESDQLQIEEEHLLYDDIVQGNFLDTYHNLTHKAVLTLRWASTFCCNSELIIKLDDDVTIKMPKLIQELDTFYSGQSRKMFCLKKPYEDNSIWRNGGKWNVEKDYFAGMKYFPYPTCSGFFIAITPDIILDLYEAATKTPFFWIDDVYITGILPSALEDVEVVDLGDEALELDYICALLCLKKGSCKLTAFVQSSSPNYDSKCSGKFREKQIMDMRNSFLS